MNFEIIKKSISSIVSLNDDEWHHLFDLIEAKTLKKNTYLLKELQVCKWVAFVNSGTLVYYKLMDSGKEVATDFAFAGEWVTDNISRLNNMPSSINIKTLEDCEISVITSENMEKCYKRIPKLERLGRILIEKAFVKTTQLSIDFQTLTASQRYEKLLHNHPELFQKIPLYHIANYLGIAPKSLSRIRKG